ncbi:MAG TPA: hypothetical protein VHZ76_00910 [Gammaproteobacteria bacterium]|jgi:hypothetical protein|nr:hypothetical protein [Gammaproteobacteria bacterium]
MKTFALVQRIIGRKFTFNAENMTQAQHLGHNYARYQGLVFKRGGIHDFDLDVIELTPSQAQEIDDLHNEYFDGIRN